MRVSPPETVCGCAPTGMQRGIERRVHPHEAQHGEAEHREQQHIAAEPHSAA